MAKNYIIKEGKIIRTNPFCPRCGRGVFMADHGDFWVCGKCGIRYNKEFFGKYRTRNEDIADSTITPERL